MLDWLLNVDPEALARGRLTLEWSWAGYGLACAGLAAATVALGAWAGGRGAAAALTLAAVRSALLALVLLTLLRPVLVLEAQAPRRAEVAVLLDDSLSMRIPDQPGGRRRSDELERLFAPARGEVARALEARFDTRYFRFSDRVRPLGGDDALAFAGASTRLAAALERVARTRPAALVVVSDGATSDRGLAGTVRRLRAEGIVVHAIGIGAERYALDLDLAAVRLPESALRGEILGAEVALEQRGLAGAQATVSVEVDSAIVWERTVRLTAAPRLVLRPRIPFTEPGPHRVSFRVRPVAGEVLTGNNVAERMVRVQARPLRVLHFEGEPRFEVKFVRRALGGDEALELVSLVRTAENRFYQIGGIDGAPLGAGLPSDEAALFRFDAVVLGSVGAGQLSAAQSEALAAFVARRGGGLLVLGGPRALAEGGYADSPLAALLPVVLEAGGGEPGFREEVAVRPTARGLATPVLRSGRGEPLPWERLPPLTVVNPLRAAKPGASVWLQGADRNGRPLVVLAAHRYGRGTVAVLAVANTWRWRMHAGVAPDDRTHETLWRNLVRWIAAGAGPPRRLRVAPGVVAFGEPLAVEAEILDESFRPREQGAEIRITTPLGEVLTRPLEPGSARLGLYRAQVAAREAGVYEVALGEPGSEPERAYALVSEQGEELHRSELDAARLRALAEGTGGRYLDAADAGALPGLIDDRRGTLTLERRVPLGRAPLLLLSVLVLACAEWGLRRRWSLP